MRNRILLSSAALMLVMGTASVAQMERREGAPTPPAASGAQGEPSASDKQKGGASQPGAQQQPAPQQSPRAQDQRGQQPPSTAQDQKAQPSGRTSGQAPRGGQQDEPARAQDQKAPQQPSAQDRKAPQQPSAQDRTAPQQPSAQDRKAPQQPSAQRERDDQPSRAQAPADRKGADVQITQQQQTQISQRLASRDVHRIDRTRVNFNIAIGTTVPASVRFVPLPSTIVTIVPQYRGYYYAVVEDEIVIIEPRTRRIVYVMPYGSSRASVKSERRVKLTQPNRDYVRKTVRARSRTSETTGAATREIVIGETVPETVVIERFPDPVYRRVPALRSYQYIMRDDDIYIVDRERRVIEMID